MISKKELSAYRAEIERRFSKLEREIESLKGELSAQDLRHKLELQQILYEKQIADLKASAPAEITEAEKAEAEAKRKQASLLLTYSEDPETLQKLGFKIGEGNVHE